GLIVGVIAAAVAAVPLWFALGSSSHRTPVSRHPHPSVSPSPIRYSPETVRLRHQLRNLIHERQRLLRVAKRPCGRKGIQVLSCVGSHVLYLRLIALDRRISRLLNEVAASVLVGPN